MIDPFESKVLSDIAKRLDVESQSLVEGVANGRALSAEELKYRIGQIAGIRQAMQIVEDARRRALGP